MKKTTQNVLIIGGGVAGIAAARSLADQDVAVHLVEKAAVLGGHAAQWACMATDTCKNCGACLSIETADQVATQSNVVLHLNTGVASIEKKGPDHEVTLEDNTRFSVKKIILATGFSPFDPDRINSFHHGEYKNLITTAELNTLLKEETIGEFFQGKKAPKIAFIQCVGSRNRDQGRDYCSQVCCKISMRHAAKLTHLYPEAGITIFHMDLQIIGKEARPLFNTLSENISLVQGVPAEILRDRETDMLTLVAEDRETRSRKTRAFDFIVLSVGMLPSRDLDSVAGTLGLKPNAWGFFNTDQAALSKDVIVAGCAKGPADILASQQDGRMAAARVVEELGLKPVKTVKVAVFGEGPQAENTATMIASKGYPTYLFGPGTGLEKETPVTILNSSRMISMGGTAGHFSFVYESGNKKQTLDCGAIVLAYEPAQSLPRLPGLTNSPLGLETLAGFMDKDPDLCPDHIAILLDYSGPEYKSSARLALDTAIKAKSLGKTVSIIMNKMLVHGASGQRRYDLARQQGVDFFRFDKKDDLDISDSGHGVLIKLKEATLPSIVLDIPCDSLVLPSAITPGSGFKDAAALFRQPLDTEGFLQSPNTRHRLTRSPRKGIFYAGPCHDEVDTDDVTHEIDDILSALSLDAVDLPSVDPGVEIDQKKCAQCLTCIRICPHAAIVMNEKRRPQIVPDACFSCHLCVSNCPAYAIESKTLANDRMARKVKKEAIVVLACERSAALAAEGLALPDTVSLTQVPCACRISPDILLRTLLKGASKVIVCGCHQGNCRSSEGSSVAAVSVKKVSNLPGVDAAKVLWEPVAANETRKFERIISKASE